MAFKIGNILDVQKIEADISGLNSQNRINTLFAVRAQILRLAGEDADYRETVFEQRAALAELFRDFGEERHEDSAKIFEGLAKPDDLLNHVNTAHARKPERKRERPFAFHTYGPKLNSQQVSNMKKHINDQGRKMGFINPLSLLELLHILKQTHDDRPIYVTQPLDERLGRQLALVTQMDPRLKDRLFILEWDGEIPCPKPITETAFFQSSSTALVGKENVIRRLRNFVYHQPEPGDMYFGFIVKDAGFGLFVEITPGVEGLVHKDEIPCDLIGKLNEGDRVTVSVIKVDRQGKIWLSMKKAQEIAAEGKQPLFTEKVTRLLTDGMDGSERPD